MALKKKLFHAGTYDCDYWVIVGNAPQKAGSFVRKLANDKTIINPNGLGAFYFKEGMSSVIWLRYRPTDLKKMSTLVHECAHASFEVMRWAGIPLTDSSEEAYTHLVSKMVRDVLGWARKT